MSTPTYRKSRFDYDCYIVDWSEAEQSEQPSELSDMSFGSDIRAEPIPETTSEVGWQTETASGSDTESSSSSDGFLDPTSTCESSDSDEPRVPEKIIWGKPMFSRRVLEVRRGVENACKLRQAAQTVAQPGYWEKVMQSKSYKLVQAACKAVQEQMKKE